MPDPPTPIAVPGDIRQRSEGAGSHGPVVTIRADQRFAIRADHQELLAVTVDAAQPLIGDRRSRRLHHAVRTRQDRAVVSDNDERSGAIRNRSQRRVGARVPFN
jgi:hypothetical protein